MFLILLCSFPTFNRSMVQVSFRSCCSLTGKKVTNNRKFVKGPPPCHRSVRVSALKQTYHLVCRLARACLKGDKCLKHNFSRFSPWARRVRKVCDSILQGLMCDN